MYTVFCFFLNGIMMFILYCNLLSSHSNLSLRSSLVCSYTFVLFNCHTIYFVLLLLDNFPFFFFFWLLLQKEPNTAISSRFFCAAHMWRFPFGWTIPRMKECNLQSVYCRNSQNNLPKPLPMSHLTPDTTLYPPCPLSSQYRTLSQYWTLSASVTFIKQWGKMQSQYFILHFPH